MSAVIDYIGQTYWSSHNAEEFVNKVEATSQGDAKVTEELKKALPHFAYGCVNGVWGGI